MRRRRHAGQMGIVDPSAGVSGLLRWRNWGVDAEIHGGDDDRNGDCGQPTHDFRS
jgi:hypothetical protein